MDTTAIAYLRRLAELGTTTTTGALAASFGDSERQGRRRVDLLAEAGLCETRRGAGVRLSALGWAAANR